MKKIIEELKSLIKSSKENGDEPKEASWGDENGILLTRNEAQKIVDSYEQLNKIFEEVLVNHIALSELRDLYRIKAKKV